MITKECWKLTKWQIKQSIKYESVFVEEYIIFLMLIIATPILLAIDLLLLPFEIGYYYFKKSLGK